MKLLTYSDGLHSRIAALRDDHVVDLVALAELRGTSVPADMLSFIAAGEENLSLANRLLDGYTTMTGDGISRHVTAVNILSPIERPNKNVFAVARNYLDHVAEGNRALGQNLEPPAAPVFFTKPPLSVIGPEHDIPYDHNATSVLDYEGELAIVFGKLGRNIEPEEALSYVFGYTIGNDVTARDLQQKHQITKGKSLDGSCPVGPIIVTADEIPDWGELEIVTRVNGEERQRDKAGNMIHGIPALIAALSLGQSVEPGEILLTGTPSGVGFAMVPPKPLQDHDLVEITIEPIGTLRNRVAPR